MKSREALLKEHRQHWGAVRRKWHYQAHKNEERFAESANILSTIFKRYLFHLSQLYQRNRLNKILYINSLFSLFSEHNQNLIKQS